MPAPRKPGRPPDPDLLTPAEWRVADAVRHGLTNRQIAARQGVSLDAVKYHVSNVLTKLGLRTRMDLRRWPGVALNSALHAKGNEMSEATSLGATDLGAIGQISRAVRDIAAARQWYGEVLGLPHLYSFGDLAFFDCGGVRLFLSQSDKDAGESILYFRVADIHTTQVALAGRGVAFINAPHMIHRHQDGTEEWMAFFNDNEDRPLALMAQVAPVAK